jgi:hypothetical protein
MSGRLGNQLFQYAFGRALETRTGVPVVYDDSQIQPMLRDWFPCVRARFASRMEWSHEGLQRADVRGKSDEYSPRLFTKTPTEFIGYFANERYFADISRTLRKELALPWPVDLAERDAGLLSRIDSPGSVMVCTRHGSDFRALNWTVGPHYYPRAMDYMRERVPGCRFFVFGDDTEWCERAFGRIPDAEVVGLRVQPPWWQLQVMGLCRHAIIANSTFTWWSAWLGRANDGIVVAPDPWRVVRPDITDVVCDRWIRVDSVSPYEEVYDHGH